MLMMRALWGPPWRRKKPRKTEPFNGGARGSAALASGPIRPPRRAWSRAEPASHSSASFKGRVPEPPTLPKIASNSRGALREASKRHPRGCNTRWCEKHENLVKTMGFYEKPRPQNTRSTPLKPSRACIIGPSPSFSHGARARPKPRFSRFGGGTGSPKPGEHHEHQQPWPAAPRQQKMLKNAVNTVFF